MQQKVLDCFDGVVGRGCGRESQRDMEVAYFGPHVWAGSSGPGPMGRRIPPAEGAMNCVVCHGQDIEVREVKEEVRLDQDLNYVPIQTRVCLDCGERYYDRATLRYLEVVEEEIRSGRVKVREVGKVLAYG